MLNSLFLLLTEVTLLRVSPVNFATPEAVKSSAKWRTSWRDLRSEILDRP